MSTMSAPQMRLQAALAALRAAGHPMMTPTEQARAEADLRAWAAGRRDCCNSPFDGGHAWGCETPPTL